MTGLANSFTVAERGALESTAQGKSVSPQQGSATVLNLPSLPSDAKCACMRSQGYDPTGENAVECKAPAAIECEYCGPMCGACHEENSCIFSQHKIIAVSV